PGDRPARQLGRRARLGDQRGAAHPRPRDGSGQGDARRLAVLPGSSPRLVHADREAVRERTMATTLITGGTVVSATGRSLADVLVDGETIRAVLEPGSVLLGTDLKQSV